MYDVQDELSRHTKNHILLVLLFPVQKKSALTVGTLATFPHILIYSKFLAVKEMSSPILELITSKIFFLIFSAVACTEIGGNKPHRQILLSDYVKV